MEREGLSNGLKDSIISPQEHEYKSPSPSQLNTTGRRKGRPKKLLSHSEPNEDEELDVVSNTSNESLRVMIPPVTSQVPSQTASPEGVEQYPVMILQENNEEGPAVLVKYRFTYFYRFVTEKRDCIQQSPLASLFFINFEHFCRSSRSQMFFRIEVLKKYRKFPRKTPRVRTNIFLIKLNAFRAGTLLKDSNTSVTDHLRWLLLFFLT